MIDYFISYAREDGDYARALVTRLTDDKWTVWIDEKDIPPSVPWAAEIQRSIEESMLVIAIESDDWLASDACHIELQLAEQSRVPVVRVTPDLTQLDAQLPEVTQAYRTLPEWRGASLEAAASAAIWDAAGRKGSLLRRGRRLGALRRILRAHPADFSPTATSFIRASTRALTRRVTAALILGLIIPALVIGIGISVTVLVKTNATVAQAVANATALADRRTYTNWNIYAGLERAPTNVSDSFANFSELFNDLTTRTPSGWDATPVTTPGTLTAPSPDGALTAIANGAEIVVTGSAGASTRLLAGSAVTAVAWSPDSRWIAAATRNGADVISVLNAQVIPLRGGIGAMISVSWDGPADVSVGGSAGTGTWQVFDGTDIAELHKVRYGTTVGHTMYTVDSVGAVTATDTGTGVVTSLTPAAGATPTSIDSTPGALVIPFDSSEPFLRVVATDDGSTRDIPLQGCSPIGLSVTADGSAAYLTCSDPRANRARVDLSTGAITTQPFGTQFAYGVRVLGDRVLWGGVFGGVFQSDLNLKDGGLLTSAAGCGAPIRKFLGASDGSALFLIGDATGTLACATRIKISDTVQVDHLVFPASDAQAVPDAAISPDGSLIAYGLADGQVRVFTTDDFYPMYFAQVMPDQVRSIAFAADGKSVVVAGLSSEITSVPLAYTTPAAAEKGVTTDALKRLQDALDWHIYQLTTDPSERK